jgi:hypothetical protein
MSTFNKSAQVHLVGTIIAVVATSPEGGYVDAEVGFRPGRYTATLPILQMAASLFLRPVTLVVGESLSLDRIEE